MQNQACCFLKECSLAKTGPNEFHDVKGNYDVVQGLR